VKTRLRTAVRAIVRAETPETIAAEIAAAQEEARTARAESERLATLAATELNDDAAEEALRQSRSQDRAERRAEARIAELRERLAGSVALAVKGARPDEFVRSDGKNGLGHRRCSRRSDGGSTAPTRSEPSAQCNRSDRAGPVRLSVQEAS
jgi:hypothetical protein